MNDMPFLRNASDRLIIDHADRILGPTGLLILLNGTQLAAPLLESSVCTQWNVLTLEHFFVTALVERLSDNETLAERNVNIELHCQPDLPEGEFDTIVFPTNSRSSSLLVTFCRQQQID